MDSDLYDDLIKWIDDSYGIECLLAYQMFQLEKRGQRYRRWEIEVILDAMLDYHLLLRRLRLHGSLYRFGFGINKSGRVFIPDVEPPPGFGEAR